jgi:ERCC4-related helicase
MDQILMSRKTYCTDQIAALRKRAEVIARDISPSLAETYIQACRNKFFAGVQQNDVSWMPDLSYKEKSHLAKLLTNLHVDQACSDETLSPKLQLLLDILKEESGPSFTGIIFVEQRAVVAALAEHISSNPEMSKLFDVGTFVGGSNSSKKKSNIGIDISSCQTVICFDAPLNLVSFVQRRGRARKKDSKYIILLADDDSKGEPTK